MLIAFSWKGGFNISLGGDESSGALYLKNYTEIVEGGTTSLERRARRFCLDSLEAALVASEPKRLMQRKVKVRNGDLVVAGNRISLAKYRRVVVIGGGKATKAMADVIEHQLGDHISDGLINVPEDQINGKLARIRLHGATHPLPSMSGVDGVEEMLEIVGRPSRETLVICLISGGGSALMPLPRGGLTLSDKIHVTKLLLMAGANIRELNVVRKHLSEIKGGWLARKVHPSTSVALVISDVVGDPFDSIASGPLYPDLSTFKDALQIVRRYGLQKKMSRRVLRFLREGAAGKILETPKPGEKWFDHTHHFLVGSNADACGAARQKLDSLGRKSLFLTSSLEGEARYAGMFLSSVMREAHRRRFLSVIAGGETTVKVTGHGRGGRNQEAALGALMRLRGTEGIAIAFIGTDGMDGPTDAAGAIVDSSSVERVRSFGVDPHEYLRRNDSYSFFKKMGDLVFTGPTGTNVNDVAVGVRG